MKKTLILFLGLMTLSCSETNVKPTQENVTQSKNETEEMNVYQFNYESPNGEENSMNNYKGKVILVVNTATQCGLTPQFEGLEELHNTYSKKGLKVLGFPCNQFGGQEPLSNEEMVETCKLNHGVTFELAKKIEVNGTNQHELYHFLKEQQPLETDENEIRWNFEKFLINRNGNVVKRYHPQTTPVEIASDIESML